MFAFEKAPCCLTFNLEANAWRTLAWHCDLYVEACCATDAVVVAFSCETYHHDPRLRILRPGSAEGWVPIPDTPVDVLSFYDQGRPSFCSVEGVLYAVGGVEAGPRATVSSDTCQASNLSTRVWTVRAPLSKPQCFAACLFLAGRLYVVGGDDRGGYCIPCSDVFSYDPRTDQWRSEPLLPLGNYRTGGDDDDDDDDMEPGGVCVAHEDRVVVVGIRGASPLALVYDAWTELPPPPAPGPDSRWNAHKARHVASLCL